MKPGCNIPNYEPNITPIKLDGPVCDKPRTYSNKDADLIENCIKEKLKRKFIVPANEQSE